jgi:hypothetical protein
MKIMYYLRSIPFSILFLSSVASSLPVADASVYNLFNQTNASIAMLKKKSGTDCAFNDFTSLSDSILKKQKMLHSIIVSDTDGRVYFETAQAGTSSMAGVTINRNRWFSNALQGNTTTYEEIVKIDNKKVLLKSWVSSGLKGEHGPFLIAVLIDLEEILIAFSKNTTAPSAQLYNGQIVYESDWISSTKNIIDIPELNGIKIAFAQSSQQYGSSESINDSADEKTLLLIITALSVLVGIAGVVSFLISQKTTSKMKDVAWLKMEEEQLSDEEKEKIRKLAVSHVYCEIKRQVETHEMEDITKKVREEIKESIRTRYAQQGSYKIHELTSVQGGYQ